MEENKKPKRRRIGESQEMNGESGHFEKVTYNPKASFVPTDSAQGAPVEGGSDAAPRQDYRRPNYNNQNSYNSYGNNRQGGYNNNRQGGYNNYNNRQGGYNNRQGGYNNNRQGGYNNNNRQGGYNNNRPGASFNRQGGQRFTPRPKQIVYDVPEVDPNEEVRLNKFMANAGICSRREADELIQQGLVKVNGNVVTELGSKIKRDDVVEYNDKVVTLENKCYILLNKPKDCVTTSDDPDGRLTVMDIVKNACKERIYPVGRLDRNTTGVLLLTNDGDLASKLTHPKYVKKKSIKCGPTKTSLKTICSSLPTASNLRTDQSTQMQSVTSTTTTRTRRESKSTADATVSCAVCLSRSAIA